MNKQRQQVPDDLAAIISEEQKRLALEKNIQEVEEHVREKERLESMKKEWRTFLKEVKPMIPEMLHRYIAKARTEEHWRSRILHLHIPGLAPVTVQFEWKDPDHRVIKEICVSGVFDSDPTEMIRFLPNWGKSFYPASFSTALAYAANEYVKFTKVTQERSERKLEQRRSARASERRERENEKRAALAVGLQQSEEQMLFDAVKEDPVAIHLLKAFLLIREERWTFAEQLENAESWAEASERRMAEKLRLAKEDVKSAQRETEDERRRKEDLQDEIDKAEKKAKRGW